MPLARRHYELGKLYLSLGWPTGALVQSDKARDINKRLLAKEDLTDENVSETEALHPRILLLNAQANLRCETRDNEFDSSGSCAIYLMNSLVLPLVSGAPRRLVQALRVHVT